MKLRTCNHQWDEPKEKGTYCYICGIPYWAYEWIEELKAKLEQQAKDAELGRAAVKAIKNDLVDRDRLSAVCQDEKEFTRGCKSEDYVCSWYEFCRLRAEGEGGVND